MAAASGWSDMFGGADQAKWPDLWRMRYHSYRLEEVQSDSFHEGATDRRTGDASVNDETLLLAKYAFEWQSYRAKPALVNAFVLGWDARIEGKGFHDHGYGGSRDVYRRGGRRHTYRRGKDGHYMSNSHYVTSGYAEIDPQANVRRAWQSGWAWCDSYMNLNTKGEGHPKPRPINSYREEDTVMEGFGAISVPPVLKHIAAALPKQGTIVPRDSETIHCRKCDQDLPATKFPTRNGGGRLDVCRKCRDANKTPKARY